MKKVGIRYLLGTRTRLFSYKDVVADEEGWIKAKDFLPPDYDLVLIKTSKDRIVAGWHTGHYWEGLKLPANQIVEYWKRREEEDEDT